MVSIVIGIQSSWNHVFLPKVNQQEKIYIDRTVISYHVGVVFETLVFVTMVGVLITISQS